MAHPFAVQDKFTRKTQDLNPECKEGSIPIMLLGVLLGLHYLQITFYSLCKNIEPFISFEIIGVISLSESKFNMMWQTSEFHYCYWFVDEQVR